MVEATRMGTVFASNLDAYRKWGREQARRQPQRSLSGDALERALMNVAAIFPGNVERVS